MQSPFRLSLLLLGALSLFLGGCQTTTSTPAGSSAAAPAPLRVGVTPALAPMVFKLGGELAGFEVDAARELGRHLNRPVKFVSIAWEGQIDALMSGKTDIIMSSMTITSERRMRVEFSNPYLNVGQLMLIKRTDMNRYALGIPRTLPGTVGVLKGTFGEFYMEREFGKSKRRAFTSPEAAVDALVDGRIAAFVSDAPIVWYQASANEAKGLGIVPQVLTQEALGWGVRAGDTALLTQVNEFITQRQADGSMNAMIKRWLPHSN